MIVMQVGLRKKEDFTVPRFVDHPSFHENNARTLYRPKVATTEAASHMPDDATRDLAKCMHYAAFRLSRARTSNESWTWHERYLDLRDQIVLGNRKLIYRAVHSRVRDPQLAEDCMAECHLVMIRAVTAYNPWLGIRFSTYAFTCLLRELTRMVQKYMKDRLRQATSFDDDLFNEHPEPEANELKFDGLDAKIRQFFTDDHTLLSGREKRVLGQRFGFLSDGSTATLKDIGSEMEISKERVRQLQNNGLLKLREVFADDFVGA